MATAKASTTSAAVVVDRVTALIPQLRETATETEKARRVLPDNLDALEEAGAFKLTIPRGRGGYETDLDTIGEVLAQIARGCTSTAWVASLINVGNWCAGVVDDETAEEMYSVPGLRTAGVFAPTGTATPVDGGYRLTGRWGFNTGSTHCSWGGFAAMAQTPDGQVPTFFLVPYSELTMLDDWNAFGMAGTASGTTVANDVFVPTRRTLPVDNLVQGQFPQRRYSSNPYFNRPAVQFFSAASSGPLVGTARGAMDVFLERLPGRSITYTNYKRQAEAPITHHQLAEAAFELEITEDFMRKANHSVDDYLGTTPPMDARIRTRAYVGQVAAHARASVTVLFQASGATAITEAVAVQRYYRDAVALANHALLQPTTATELYGRLLAGQEPNSVFF